MSELLKCVEIVDNPNQLPITHSVIWLHGLGADGHDFAPIVPNLALSGQFGVRFIFPHAPKIPVTINQGYVMPAWYDIFEMDLDRKVDVAQIEASAQQIMQLIDREMQRGVKSENIVIAGFSQGGAVAYQTALSFDQPLAGLLTLSTYLATKDTLVVHPANQGIKIAVHHGLYDPIVSESLGQQAIAWLKQQNLQADYLTYPMEHQVCIDQIKDIGNWLNQVLI